MRLQILRERLSSVVGEVRRSVRTLRTSVGENESLGTAIGSLARHLSGGSGVPIQVTLDESTQRLRPDVEAELLRITQEAMNNAVRHSEATLIEVQCTVAPPLAEITIADDGRGILGRREDSHGLEIMAERARLVEARFTVQRREPRGTVISVVLEGSPSSRHAVLRSAESPSPSSNPSARGVSCSRDQHPPGRLATMSLRTPEGDTTVLVVDDHELIRQGLVGAFGREPGMTVVGEAATVTEALKVYEEQSPQVVVTDLQLPDGTGLDIIRAIRRDNQQAGLVVVTMHSGDDQIFAAMEAGASAFVGKDAPSAEVVKAAKHAVVSPRSFLCAGLVGAMMRRASAESTRLSDREHQVLVLLADGLGAGQIAQQLYLSESTAKSHIARIYQKLGASNRAQALVTAMRIGLLSQPAQPRPPRLGQSPRIRPLSSPAASFGILLRARSGQGTIVRKDYSTSNVRLMRRRADSGRLLLRRPRPSWNSHPFPHRRQRNAGLPPHHAQRPPRQDGRARRLRR